MTLAELSPPDLTSLHGELVAAYDALVRQGLNLDLTRGKPSPAQLDLSNALLNLPGAGDYRDASGVDCRNYGGTQGLREIREIFAELLGVPMNQLVAGDNASLAVMHDTLVYCLLKGPVGGIGPWVQSPTAFVCPVPATTVTSRCASSSAWRCCRCRCTPTVPTWTRSPSWSVTTPPCEECGWSRRTPTPTARSIPRRWFDGW